MPLTPQAATLPMGFRLSPLHGPSPPPTGLLALFLLGHWGGRGFQCTLGAQSSPRQLTGVHAAPTAACQCWMWASQALRTPPLQGSNQGLPECCEGVWGTPAPSAPRTADPIVFHLCLSLKLGGFHLSARPLRERPQWPIVGPLPVGPSGDSGGCKVAASKGVCAKYTPRAEVGSLTYGNCSHEGTWAGGHPWIYLKAPGEQGPRAAHFPVHSHQPPKYPDLMPLTQGRLHHPSQVPPRGPVQGPPPGRRCSILL